MKKLLILKRRSGSVSKLSLKMKLSTLIILATLFSLQANTSYSQRTKISLHLANVTVKSVLDQIESSTDFRFAYKLKDVDLSRKVSVNVQNELVTQVIKDVFINSETTFSVIDLQIFLVKKEVPGLGGVNSDSQFNDLQQTDIKGSVVDKDGAPLPGASIIEKGTTNGTQSDFDGNFNITVSSANAVLVVSYIGFSTKEIPADGKSNIIIGLEESSDNLDEVVVTALGISREKKALGYAVQEVQGEIFEKSKELDLNNSLNGRVSGVFISQGRSNLGTSNARIVIRGESSIGGNNTPLYIVDGFPASFINPNDVESLSVLKGPAATALYGSRAAAGVIVITTKSGKKSQGLSVAIGSSVTMANPAVLPDYQTDYGQGLGGVYQPGVDLSWGPAFTLPSIQQLWGGNEWRPYTNAVEEAYDTGYTLNNNVAISGGDEKSDIRLSYTDVRQNGMVPNTEFKEHTIDLNTNRNFTDKFSVRVGVKYRLTDIPNNGSFDPRFIPLNVDPEVLKKRVDENGNQIMYKSQTDNPYFNLYEDQNLSQSKSLSANISLNYKFTEQLSLLVRTSLGDFNGKTENKGAFGHAGAGKEFGSYHFNKYSSNESNTDFLLTYATDFSNWTLKTSAGGNHLHYNRENIAVSVSQLLTEGTFTAANYRQFPRTTSAVGPEKTVNSLYAYANIGFKDYAYLDLTARNDWSSALPEANNSFFYPSASLSVLIHNLVELPGFIDFWKIRNNYAEVGNDTSAGRLQYLYLFTPGINGVAGIGEESTFPELNLKPEISSAYEIGTEFKLFNNRFNLDFTYYNSVTENQIWSVPVSDVTGYTRAVKNVGKVKNTGYEVSVGGTLIKNNNFSWQTSLNWSSDKSVVQELDPNNPDLSFTQSVASNTFIIDRAGDQRGQIYSKTARTFIYDPTLHNSSLKQYDGQRYHDAAKDLPRVADMDVIGNVNPDWIAGWENTFTFKNWSLGALITGVYGNSFYAGFEKNFVGDGFAPITGGNRDAILPEGVWDSPTGIRPFEPGDEITAGLLYGDYLTDGEINDIWVRDGSFAKLKELSLSYTIPSKLLENMFFKDVRFTVLGRNLYTLTDVKYVDPEIFVNNSQVGTTPGISRSGTIPMARTWSFNVNLRF